MSQNSVNNTASTFSIDDSLSVGTTLGTNNVSIDRSASGPWIQMDDQTDSFGYYNNAGSPEGVVAADIGSVCTDSTNGELYIKQTDTVNTGWVQLTHSVPIGQHIVQITESVSTTAVNTASAIPFDSSIPQISEGASFITHAHTPLDASNILKIEFMCWGSGSPTVNTSTVALFEQPTANALSAVGFGATSDPMTIYLYDVKAAGGTGAITYEVRFGPSGGVSSCTLNGENVATHRYGAAGKAYIRVTEYTP